MVQWVYAFCVWIVGIQYLWYYIMSYHGIVSPTCWRPPPHLSITVLIKGGTLYPRLCYNMAVACRSKGLSSYWESMGISIDNTKYSQSSYYTIAAVCVRLLLSPQSTIKLERGARVQLARLPHSECLSLCIVDVFFYINVFYTDVLCMSRNGKLLTGFSPYPLL